MALRICVTSLMPPRITETATRSKETKRPARPSGRRDRAGVEGVEEVSPPALTGGETAARFRPDLGPDEGDGRIDPGRLTPRRFARARGQRGGHQAAGFMV